MFSTSDWSGKQGEMRRVKANQIIHGWRPFRGRNTRTNDLAGSQSTKRLFQLKLFRWCHRSQVDYDAIIEDSGNYRWIPLTQSVSNLICRRIEAAYRDTDGSK